jgi:hypothetical protein
MAGNVPAVMAAVPSTAPALRPLGARRRWWRCAHEGLEAMLRQPVVVTARPRYRYVEVLGLYGLQVDTSLGCVESFEIPAGDGLARCRYELEQPLRLHGSPHGSEWLHVLIVRHTPAWAVCAGATALDAALLERLCERLTRPLIARWTARGTLARLREQIAQAFDLDPELLRLAQQITARSPDPGAMSGADEGDYNAALRHREALQVLEREAPSLMPLYAAMVPLYALDAEPVRALRTAFVERHGSPRHWRRFLRLPQGTLAWARDAWPPLRQHPWVDLADFVARLDVHTVPPLAWLQAVAALQPALPIGHELRGPAWSAVLVEHLRAWEVADEPARHRLDTELACIAAWVDEACPGTPPKGLRWRGWVRRVTAWTRAQRAATLFPGTEVLRGVAERDGTLAAEPLCNPWQYRREAEAMEHCLASTWTAHAEAGRAVAWAVFDTVTGERVATVGAWLDPDEPMEVQGRPGVVFTMEELERIVRLVQPQEMRWRAHCTADPTAPATPQPGAGVIGGPPPADDAPPAPRPSRG